MTCWRFALLTIYAAAFLAEVLGIVFASKDVLRLVEDGEGLYRQDQPEGWRLARGPIAIGLGAALGAAGNITSMFVSS